MIESPPAFLPADSIGHAALQVLYSKVFFIRLLKSKVSRASGGRLAEPNQRPSRPIGFHMDLGFKSSKGSKEKSLHVDGGIT